MAQEQEYPNSWIPEGPSKKPTSWISESLPNNPPSARSRGAGPGATGVPPASQVSTPPSELVPEQPTEDRNWWQHLTQAPQFITEGAQDISNWLTTPTTKKKGLTTEAIAAGGVMHEKEPLDLSKVPPARRAEIEKLYQSDQYETSADPLSAFTGGAIEGAGHMLSPANIALTLIGGGEVAALNRARSLISLGKIAEAGAAARTARNLETITRLASVPVGVSAGSRLVDPESTMVERLTAVPELAGALLGVRSRVRPTLEATPVPNLSGQAAAATPDIPLKLNEAGTFAPEDLDLNVPVTPPKPALPAPVRPSTARFSAVTLKPGPMQMQEVLRLGNEGYRVVGHDQEGNIKMVPQDAEMPAGPDGEDVALSRGGYIDPKVAIIEDTSPKWVGYGENGEDLFNVAIPKPSGESGEIQYSHGMLTPETEAQLKQEGYIIKRRSEMEPQRSRAIDEIGEPVDVKDWTPEQLEVRKKEIATAWYNARKEATELGIEHKKIRNLTELQQQIDAAKKPSAQKTIAAKGLKTQVNVKRAARELSSGYSTPLPGIMVREGLQNALDAIKAVGGGETFVDITPEGLTIGDQGKGMTLEQLKTVYKDLNESGKLTEEGATGGKGVGKASYMLGGKYFSAETVVNKGGKKIKYTLEGSPDQLMESYNIMQEEVPLDTPTGTKFTTEFMPDQVEQKYYADNMLDNIRKFSRNIPAKIRAKQYGFTRDAHPIGKFEDDTLVGADNIDNSNVSLYIPKGTKSRETDYVSVKVLNNGMYQFEKTFYPQEKTNLPQEVIINVKPKMEEGAPDYPFPVQRESIKDATWNKIEQFITDSLVNPMARRQRADLMTFWNALPMFATETPTTRPALLFDSGSRLTPSELTEFHSNPIMNNLMNALDTAINDILMSSNPGEKVNDSGEITEHDWEKKVQHVGMILDDSVNGIHIPDPREPGAKSAILINPFNNMANHNPERAAMDMIVTAMHETAHVGKTVRSVEATQMLPEDLEDPRVGTYLQSYLQEVKDQGGIDFSHGMDFVKRLGDIWVRYGTTEAMKNANTIIGIISDPGNPGRYSPEVQDLIFKYTESRRRDATQTDILSRTGIKSAVTGSGKSPITGSNGPDGERVLPRRVALKAANTKKLRRAALDAGLVPTGYSDSAGNPIWERPPEGKTSKLNELWNLPRGLMSVDLPFITSAALRQGLPLIGANFRGWIKAWGNAARAYSSEQAAAGVAQDLSRDPLLQRGRDDKGRETPSYAEQVGLELTDTKNMNRREEVIKSRWGELIPLWGRHVAASNRAYTSFLNTIRVSSLRKFVQQAQDDASLLRDETLDPKKNMELGKNIADAINVLSGRGKLEFEATPGTKYTKSRKYSVERAARTLVDIFFSPRLLASRIKMLNPNTYISADPFTRKLYLKGLMSAIATWWSIAALLELAGWEVSKDPNSADFGKAKLDNTRIDPGGGFQQFLVLFSRLRPEWFRNPVPMPFPPHGEMVEDPGGGKFTDSTTGDTRPLGEGFRPITREELMYNFGRSKLHPSAAFAMDLFRASQRRPVYVGDRLMQMATPMMTGDLFEVLQENPALLPAVIGAGSIGMGASTYEGGTPKPVMTPMLDQLGIPATDSDLVLGQ